MVNSYRIIPVYTGDVSGAASALYELGGMTVIHDPSGCNSTYNTHDETRWYDEDSLIYISGLNEVDAILGNDEKFINDIVYAAGKMHPKFIALASSPIPFLNGTDFQGIARVIEKRTGVATFYVPTNGTHDYSIGAGEAFAALAARLLPEKDLTKTPGSRVRINVLGVTPLDFDAPGAIDGLKEKLADFEILSVWAQGSDLEELAAGRMADVNLVVSVTGLKLARWMEAHWGIPYVVGCPVGAYAPVLSEQLQKAARGETIAMPAEEATADPVYLVGEPVMAMSLREHLKRAAGIKAQVVNPLETPCPTVSLNTRGEEDLEALLQGASWVVADPLYRPLLSAGTKFTGFSHEAFSGRIFRGHRVNVFDEEALKRLFEN